jgi:hypothetical protein
MAVKIYAIRNRTSELVYVGSTKKRLLCSRLAEHRADVKRGSGITSGQILSCPTAYIELLEDLGDCEKAVRKERERWWIRNTPNCVNLHVLRDEEEERRASVQATMAYHARNRDAHNAYMREYRARHPDRVRETNRKQYEKRKSNA